MKLENLRTKQLTFKDTFLYLKEVLVLNRTKFLAIFFLWFLFTLLLTVIIRFSYDYIAAFSTVIAYVVFYIFYLNFAAKRLHFLPFLLIFQFYCGIIENNKEVGYECYR